MSTALHSEFLRDIRDYFEAHRSALSSKGELEFEQEPDELVSEELFEVVLSLKSDVYLVLTIWGDQRACFVVRESSKKRRHKAVLLVRDFPLMAIPRRVFETFKGCASSLYRLSSPPGTAADESLLEDLRQRWLSLSRDQLH